MGGKCICCYKEIYDFETNGRYYGLDGDKIHIACEKAQEDKITKICNMSNSEFEGWVFA